VPVTAPPHDLLKVVTWRGHGRSSDQHGEFGHTNLSLLAPISGVENYEDLASVVKSHPEWEADKVAAAAARLRLRRSYWDWKRKERSEWETEPNDPFFVRLYGGFRRWSLEERRKLFNEILEVYEGGVSEEAHAKVNELLSEYPQDSRFPLVSLKTHHWATWVIHKQLGAAEDVKSIFVFKISVYAPGVCEGDVPFHRLRDLRKFYDLREKIAVGLTHLLRDFQALRLEGCEDVLVITTGRRRGELKARLLESGFPLEVEVFRFEFEKGSFPWGKYRVSGVYPDVLSFGAREELEGAPEPAEWANVLDGEFEYAAWIALKTQGLYECAEEFLKWFEEEARNLKVAKEFEVPEPEGEWLCYELLVSVADGYSKFLADFEKNAQSKRLGLKKVLKSFNLSLYLYGLRRLGDAIWLYSSLRRILTSLEPHFPLSLSVMVSDPKFPFWRVLEMLEGRSDSGLLILKGDRMLELPDEVVDMIFRLRYEFERDSRKQVHALARRARKVSRKNLELEIERRFAERKISEGAYDALRSLVGRISRLCGGDEARRRELTGAAIEALESFVRRD